MRTIRSSLLRSFIDDLKIRDLTAEFSIVEITKQAKVCHASGTCRMDQNSTEKTKTPLQKHLRKLLEPVESRPPSDSLYLSGTPAKYILRRNSGHLSHQENKIEQTVSDIPIRIERLLYDIAILKHGEYLDNKDKHWKLLSSLCGTPSAVTRATYGKYPVNNRDSLGFNLGFDIGLALSALTGHQSESKHASEFFAGLCAAYVAPKQPYVGSSGQKESIQNNNVEPQEDLLRQYGIQPTNYLSGVIYRYSTGQNHIDDENLTSKNVTEAFLNYSLDEWFHKIVTLRIHIDDEWDSIDEADIAGMSAKEALRALWELEYHVQSGDNNTSGRIAKTAGKKERYRGQVTQVLNKLSIDGKSPSEQSKTTYEYEDIARWDDVEGEWELSEYGRILLYHVFEQNRDPEWMQKVGITESSSTILTGNSSEEEIDFVEKAMEYYYEEN